MSHTTMISYHIYLHGFISVPDVSSGYTFYSWIYMYIYICLWFYLLQFSTAIILTLQGGSAGRAVGGVRTQPGRVHVEETQFRRPAAGHTAVHNWNGRRGRGHESFVRITVDVGTVAWVRKKSCTKGCRGDTPIPIFLWSHYRYQVTIKYSLKKRITKLLVICASHIYTGVLWRV